MFDGNWRTTVDKGLVPIGASLRRAGLSADVITITGIIMAAPVAMMIPVIVITSGSAPT